MKKAASIFAVILVLCCMLTACGKNETLTGTWTVTEDGVTMSVVLNSDGTGKVSALEGLMSVDFAYKLKGNTITFYEINEDVFGSKPYIYEIHGDRLTINQDGNTMELIKSK